MPFRDWLKSLFPSLPESRIPSTLSFDDSAVRCQWPGREMQEVAWDELQEVSILTTDEGPFVEDVYFVLAGSKGSCVIPQEAEGSQDLLKRLQELPGFDNGAFISAMASTDKARFVCWRRDSAS